jgi:prolyl-tRNA editing enzyme YbaK/EbsC (Cys-tRNA(Pro) deacylase)
MTVEAVRAFLSAHAPDLEVVELAASTTAVEMAARHGVAPERMAALVNAAWIDVCDRPEPG